MNERIEVRLPDKLKVEAPKTDAAIDALTAAFSGLSRMLEAGFSEISASLRSLRRLPEMLTAFQERVTEQFTNLFQYHVESQLHARQANIVATRKVQNTIHSSYQDKLGQLPEDRHRIEERYRKLLESVASECERHIERLDSHALDILGKVYPEQVQARFSCESMPTFDLLAGHADVAANARALCLDDGIAAIEQAVSAYIGQRKRLIEHLHELGAGEGPAPGWCETVIVFTELEDTGDGARELRWAVAGDRAEFDSAWPAEVRDRLTTALRRRLDTTKAQKLDDQDRLRISRAMANGFGVPESERARFMEARIEFVAEGAQ